jgi:hypothetical protein
MATNFPNSPSNGDTHTFGGTTYTYNSTKGVWKAGADGLSISDNAPSNPEAGDLWFDSSVAKTYIYYNDGSSSQWVQLNPSGGSDGTDGTDGADATGDGESPIIYTEPPTSHTLNMDGSTSTVQMQAVDPEGTAITYGIAYANSTNARPAQLSADTTINQTTGTYTFTPSTTESDTGSFKARLSASDGIQTSTRFVNIDLSFGLTDVYGFRFVQTSTAYIFTRFWAVILGENGSIHNETNFGTEASWSPAGDSGGDVDQTVSSLTTHYGKYFVDEASATFGQTLTTGLKTSHMFNSTSNTTHDLKWTTARTIKGILISGDDTNGNDYWSGGYVQAYVGGTTSSHLVSTQYTFVNNTVSAPAVSKYYSFL